MTAERTGRRPVLIIGVGNEFRGDDGAGLAVSRRLGALGLEGVRVLEVEGEGTAVMAAWKGADAVILADAVYSGAVPGTVHRLEAHARPVPGNFFHMSSHAISVADAIELARSLGELPPRFIVYGIEGKSFEAGVGLSPEVEKAGQEVVEAVRRELRGMGLGEASDEDGVDRLAH
jgi:hydrogenase maturation protease